MDLKKLDPMARKMRTHVDAFYKALDEQDAMGARSHINEITLIISVEMSKKQL